MFGRQLETEQTLDVELFHDVQDGAEHDVDFGANRPAPTRRWWLVIGGILAVALLVIVASTFAREGDDATAPPTTSATATTASSPSTTDPPRTTDDAGQRTTVSAVTTLSDLELAAPLLPTDQSWSIFLIDQNSGRTRRIDVQTGAIETLDGSTASFVIAPEGSFTVPGAATFGYQGNLPAGPEYGSYWNMDFDNGTGQQRLVLRQVLPGSEVEEVASVPLSVNEYLLGSTAAGDAVIYGPDGDAYSVTRDGIRQKFSTGRVSSVQNGFYAEVLCDDAATCRHVLHGVAVVEGPYTQDESATFSPSGTWAALSAQNYRGEGQPVRLLNLVTGEGFDVDARFVPGYYGYGGPTSLAFTPDERWAVGISESSLVTIDLQTQEVTRTPLPRGNNSAQLAINAIF